MNINKVIVAGRLGRDPELKTLPKGTEVCSFSIASNRVWKDQQGQKQEATEWHNIVFFGKRAATVAQYFKKGKEIYIEGRLQTRSWEKDGHTNYRTEIVGDNFQFVGSRDQQSGAAGNVPKTDGQDKAAPSDKEIPTVNIDEEEIKSEDLPF